MSDAFSVLILIIVTLFVPPIGVFFVGGCCPDLFVNIGLSLLGYLPGQIHAFYCEYVYYDRRAKGHTERHRIGRAPGIFSKRIQNGGDMACNYSYPAPVPQPVSQPVQRPAQSAQPPSWQPAPAPR